jgi:HlyD family secretion protein
MLMKARVLTALFLACLAVGLAGCGSKGRNSAGQAEEKPPTLVEAATARLGELTQAIEFTGSVQSERDSMVAAKVGGKITSIQADEGDHVSAGSVLVEIAQSDYEDQVRQAESALQAARARLGQAKTQKKIGDVTIDSQIAQAQAGLRAAEDQLKVAREGARPQERAQAEAAERAARSSLETAKADFERTEALYKEGAVSKQMYDSARLGYEVARSQHEQAAQGLSLVREGARKEDIDRAEAQVEQAQQALQAALADKGRREILARDVESALANLEGAQASRSLAAGQLEDTKVRAPFPGYVAARLVDLGEVVGPGTPVISLVALDRIFLRIDVSEKDIEKIRLGMKVDVTVDAIPGETLGGKVEEILPSARTDSRNFAVKISLSDPEKRLRPGMFARARVIVDRLKNVITIPKRAVFDRGGRSYVFVVKGRVAVMKPVKLGLQEDLTLQITDGVEPGDRVVLSGQGRLKDGDKVRVQ